jgi:hypothetical protein
MSKLTTAPPINFPMGEPWATMGRRPWQNRGSKRPTLPVMDKLWRPGKARKGGFTGWKPGNEGAARRGDA